MKKKVLIIGPSYFPLPAVDGGAIEGLIDEYLKYNSKNQKYDITTYSAFSNNIDLTKNSEYKNSEFRYIKKNTFLYYIFRIICLILRKLRRNKQNPYPYTLSVLYDLKRKKELNSYDVVVIENQIESIITYRKYLKGKIVSHLHNDYLNSNTIQAQQIVDSCDEFWGVSNFICNQISLIEEKAKNKVRTLYNGVDLEKFSTENVLEIEKEQMYRKIGFSNKDFIILYVGRIMPEKGVLELVKAFSKIKNKEDNMRLLIVGPKKCNSDDIDEYYNEILFEQKKYEDSIILYGKANISELRILYSIASVQVVPSLWNEAFGLIVVEGMCGNNPLIVSNSGGIPEIVKGNAIVVDRNNIVDEIKSGILDIKNNIKKYEKMTYKYPELLKKFDIGVYNSTFEKYIETILKK